MIFLPSSDRQPNEVSSFFEILVLEASFAYGEKFLDPILVSTKVLDFVKGLTVFPKNGS